VIYPTLTRTRIIPSAQNLRAISAQQIILPPDNQKHFINFLRQGLPSGFKPPCGKISGLYGLIKKTFLAATDSNNFSGLKSISMTTSAIFGTVLFVIHLLSNQ